MLANVRWRNQNSFVLIIDRFCGSRIHRDVFSSMVVFRAVRRHTSNVKSRRARMRAELAAFVVGSALSAVLLLVVVRREAAAPRPRPFTPLPDTDESRQLAEASPSATMPRRADTELEALAAMRAAAEMRLQGKPTKAFKLFERAASLAPHHPDVLTGFGEFLERLGREEHVVRADELYARALRRSPSHEAALANRQRTRSLVDGIDREALRKIDEKRDALAAVPDSDSALRRAKKEAYFQHVYHTVGIEGNTMTLQQTRSILETRLAVAGKSVDEHNEILGLDAAMKFINSTLIDRLGDVTVNDVLEIHRRVLGYVDPTEGGFFRRTQVYVGGHVPPGPMLINALMHQFLDWLNSDDALDLHPIRLAALAHYKLVHIHPFTDGNGRTSRLLMNLILMQAGYPPIIILKQHRHLYYQHLQTANEGDVRPFVRFIAECTERTLDLYLWATSEFSHQIPALGQPTILIDENDNIIGDDTIKDSIFESSIFEENSTEDNIILNKVS